MIGPEIVLISETCLSFSIQPFRLGRGLNDREIPIARAKRIKKERGRVIWAWQRLSLEDKLIVPKGPPWDVRLVRMTTAGVGLDDDNLVGSFKSVRDQVADQLHVNDGDTKLISFAYFQQTLMPEWGIRIEIHSRPAVAPGPPLCRHLAQHFRHSYGHAGEFHVVERCTKCGARLRDGWVPQSEARGQLLEDPWARGKDPRQGRLL